MQFFFGGRGRDTNANIISFYSHADEAREQELHFLIYKNLLGKKRRRIYSCGLLLGGEYTVSFFLYII